jgi:hypothetical protein
MRSAYPGLSLLIGGYGTNRLIIGENIENVWLFVASRDRCTYKEERKESEEH